MNTNYDLIIIGGGPAGMMAAGQAGASGARVLLLEKNGHLGRKLIITGKGRCNITNADSNSRNLVEKFGANGKFLFSSLHKFGPDEVVDFFENLDVKTKVERGNRIFPVSDKSTEVLNTLIAFLKNNNVEIKLNSEVVKIVKKDNKIEKVVLKNGEELVAANYAICTGGLSYPGTGSTGDGYKWLEKLGHNIIAPQPALVGITIKDNFIKQLEGLSLKNVEISIFQNNKKIDLRFGEALFTGNGLSGPIILEMSKNIGQSLVKGKVELKIDFKPALDFATLDKRVQSDWGKQSNKSFKNSLDSLLPKSLIPVFIKLSAIDPEKKVNSIPKEARKKLIHLFKEFSLEVTGTEGFTHAIITSGGVDLSEIDPKTMKSKLIDNLFIAGEMLNLDGPTGGYNLQVCWSTGFALGTNLQF